MQDQGISSPPPQDRRLPSRKLFFAHVFRPSTIGPLPSRPDPQPYNKPIYPSTLCESCQGECPSTPSKNTCSRQHQPRQALTARALPASQRHQRHLSIQSRPPSETHSPCAESQQAWLPTQPLTSTQPQYLHRRCTALLPTRVSAATRACKQ